MQADIYHTYMHASSLNVPIRYNSLKDGENREMEALFLDEGDKLSRDKTREEDGKRKRKKGRRKREREERGGGDKEKEEGERRRQRRK